MQFKKNFVGAFTNPRTRRQAQAQAHISSISTHCTGREREHGESRILDLVYEAHECYEQNELAYMYSDKTVNQMNGREFLHLHCQCQKFGSS